MFEQQHTIKSKVVIKGVGLHTGAKVTMTFKPAPENTGIIFVRTDLKDKPTVKADIDNVVDTSRGTTIADGEAKVHTVEHTLAALHGLQVDNAFVELNGPEPPVMDGSSAAYIEKIKKVGLEKQEAAREFFVVDKPIQYVDPENNVDITAMPYDDYRVTVMIDYNSPVLGSQHVTMQSIEHFEEEFSDARTFCFLHEVEELLDQGLIKGGDLKNAIVVVDKKISKKEIDHLSKLLNHPKIEVKEGILNNVELRYSNEPARHKLLDLVGDLALIGAPIKGQILAARPGHKSNIDFARKVKSQLKKKQIQKRYQGDNAKDFVFDINAIKKILPHRYPFIMIDRITEFSEDHIEGYKNVTINEPFFQGHFEGNPIMPGVLQIEAMGQIGGILLLNKFDNPEDIWVYFLAIDNARFKKMVIPGDRLDFKLDMVNMRRNICKMHGQGFVNGKLVCEADLTAAVVEKEPKTEREKEKQL